LPELNFQYVNNKSLGSSQVQNFNIVISAVKALAQIEFIKPYTTEFLENEVVAQNERALLISIADSSFNQILRNLKELKIAANMLLDFVEKRKPLLNNSLLIKLPPLKTFEDLSKVANEFKLSIDIPLHEIKEDLIIEKAEEGSIWLTIVTTVAGLRLLSGLVSAGLRIAKANAEMKWHDEQSRTIGLKNDIIESIIEAQKEFIKKNIGDEAIFIFSQDNPQTLERFKLSIEMIADLIDRGPQIRPGKIDDADIKNSFPDFEAMRLITDVTKKIQNK